jgi:transcriptional regulator with GAF, ATPase, and Fis domain
MKSFCWAYFDGSDAEFDAEILLHRLLLKDFKITPLGKGEAHEMGLCFATTISQQLVDVLRTANQAGSKHILVVIRPNTPSDRLAAWELLNLGASDVLFWTDVDSIARQILARFERWSGIEALLEATQDIDVVLGRSAAWRSALLRIVEIARFSDAATLIMGESGTGKEVAAKLIHHLDPRKGKRDLVIQDCSTLVQELSGSEFFGHERGAFTGALSERQGAFALANGGTLFLDEIGELPLAIQAQLLRAIQERTYKRVGGVVWQRSNFRLVCATNRDLEAMVGRGEFRADLFHRIAGHVCWLPPLRERLEDVMPLAQSFLRQMQPDQDPPTLDPLVSDYLLQRNYSGNVRELKQVISRLMSRCAADGTISIGYVPPEERPSCPVSCASWLDAVFETAIQRAVVMGAGLKEIGRAAEDHAIRCATEVEGGSLKRAAKRLGVTDRALQLRRAQFRDIEGPEKADGEAIWH